MKIVISRNVHLYAAWLLVLVLGRVWATVGTFQDEKCRRVAGHSCSCSGIVCLNTPGNPEYGAFGCIEVAFSQCIPEGPDEDCECTHSTDETAVLCKETSWWTGNCDDLGDLVDEIDIYMDECESSVCSSNGC